MKNRYFALVCVLAINAISAGCERRPPDSDGTPSDDGLAGGELIFQERFERTELGPNWSAQGQSWRIQDGSLRVAGARNDALWLQLPLPDQVRVEFDASSDTDVGDLKFEIFGDGATHESGYIAIYGGWNNQVTCIARRDEHGDDRLDRSEHDPVQLGQTYRIAAIRTDHRFRFYIDGQLALSFDDEAPLRGGDHAFFAFNDWEAPVRFDNVEIYDLSQ